MFGSPRPTKSTSGTASAVVHSQRECPRGAWRRRRQSRCAATHQIGDRWYWSSSTLASAAYRGAHGASCQLAAGGASARQAQADVSLVRNAARAFDWRLVDVGHAGRRGGRAGSKVAPKARALIGSTVLAAAPRRAVTGPRRHLADSRFGLAAGDATWTLRWRRSCPADAQQAAWRTIGPIAAYLGPTDASGCARGCASATTVARRELTKHAWATVGGGERHLVGTALAIAAAMCGAMT